MTSTLLEETMANQPETRETSLDSGGAPVGRGPRGISLGWGILLAVAVAGLWVIVLVLFHALTERLLR